MIASQWKLVRCTANHSVMLCLAILPLENSEHYSTRTKDRVTRLFGLFHQNQNSLSYSACLSSRHFADLASFSETVAYCLNRVGGYQPPVEVFTERPSSLSPLAGLAVFRPVAPNTSHNLCSRQSGLVEEPYPASRCPGQKLVTSTNNAGIIGGSIVCGLPIPGWEAANRFGPIP